MSEMPPCPKCQSPYVYEDGPLLICPECAHEWAKDSAGVADGDNGDGLIVRDAHGTVLVDGDSVTLIKDLKLKGSSGVIKMGTKVKNIRLVDSDHNIDCKIPGVGSIGLKSEFVKKASD